ncbi:MAG: hypothetical protein PHH83_01670 [Patescibacteria group bacterium]|nr:hypothetical protein [Patescibacteria group bacterium]
MQKIILFQKDGKKIGEFNVDNDQTKIETGDTLIIGKIVKFSARIQRVDESKYPIEIFSDDIVICPMCNNTGLQKIGDTKSTVRPCPNGCLSDCNLSHPSDKESRDHCFLCNDTGVRAMGPCQCQFAQNLQSGS